MIGINVELNKKAGHC